ncbi:hypothetical protein LCGC14_0643970 [marine sediment metagenome]|uniref:Uncharacterized protein n=1 Tax=marine sediment metagenome TaxID=412755 RepID=A0A0F9U6M8_9ZZZZ
MAYGYTAQNITARELETATTNAVDLIADLEEKVAELETEVEDLKGQVEGAEEDTRVLESDLDKAKNE